MALQFGKVTQNLCVAATSYCRIFAAKYAKKVAGRGGKVAGGKKGGPAPVKKAILEVETDAAKLTQFCCGANIYTTGTDPELKPDAEYPEWLWSLRLDRQPPDLSELDQENPQYWRRLRKLTLRRNLQLMKVKKLGKR